MSQYTQKTLVKANCGLSFSYATMSSGNPVVDIKEMACMSLAHNGVERYGKNLTAVLLVNRIAVLIVLGSFDLTDSHDGIEHWT